MSLLQVQDLEVHYGPLQALFGVDIELDEGECLALMGRNGMGKTTVVHTLCQMLRASAGSIRFRGHDLTRMASHQAARLGIGLVPEGRRCFHRLSVYENLIAAARPGAWDLAAVNRLFPRLAERRSQQAGLLSGGEQQMLVIARALMTNPRLLVLDEATEGLAPVIRQEIWQSITDLTKNSGLAIIVIDKSIVDLAKIAHRAVILEKGYSVWRGKLSELDRPTLNRYLGI